MVANAMAIAAMARFSPMPSCSTCRARRFAASSFRTLREVYAAAMGGGTDEQVLDEFFQAVTPTIEDMVTQAVRQGQRLLALAVVVERKFDGEVVGGSCPRSDGRRASSRDPRGR
jgi:hypothetical protein